VVRDVLFSGAENCIRSSTVILREGVPCSPDGGRSRSYCALRLGVNGVFGVLGVKMYRPLHFGHLIRLSPDDTLRVWLVVPARRG
jgi:hypothetical protein